MKNLNKNLENLKIKPAFCHFNILRRVGQMYLENLFTKSYFPENLNFYRGSTNLERMSLEVLIEQTDKQQAYRTAQEIPKISSTSDYFELPWLALNT